MKYLGPYTAFKDFSIKIGFIRKYLSTSGGFIVWCNEFNSVWYSVLLTNRSFYSKKAAMDALDAELLKEGYIFLTEKQFKKLKVLL